MQCLSKKYLLHQVSLAVRKHYSLKVARKCSLKKTWSYCVSRSLCVIIKTLTLKLKLAGASFGITCTFERTGLSCKRWDKVRVDLVTPAGGNSKCTFIQQRGRLQSMLSRARFAYRLFRLSQIARPEWSDHKWTAQSSSGHACSINASPVNSIDRISAPPSLYAN